MCIRPFPRRLNSLCNNVYLVPSLPERVFACSLLVRLSGEIGSVLETCVGPNLETGAVGVLGGPFVSLLAFVDRALMPLVRTDDVEEDVLPFVAGGSGMV